MGADTDLWVGLSSEVTLDMNGCYGIPWGRVYRLSRKDFGQCIEDVQDEVQDRQAS